MKRYFLTVLIFVLIISITGCSSSDKGLADTILKIRQNKIPARITKINRTTLKLEGYITKDTYGEYMKNIGPDIKTLIITSPGGDTNSGVKIGLDIQKRGLTVIVDGVAASSAANYLFLGGNKKIIRKGFVGFHGNAQAMVAQMGGFDGLKKDMQKNPQVSDKFFNEFKKEIEETIMLEKIFFKSIGVSQELFDITQSPGKGLTKGPARDFDFLLPSMSTMKKFGIKDVAGEQDVDMAVKLGIKVIYY